MKTLNTKHKRWLAPLLAIIGTFACLEGANTVNVTGLSNSVLSVILFAALTVLMHRVLDTAVSKKDRIFAGVGGAFFSVALMWGRQLDLKGSVNFLSPRMWLTVLCMWVFLTPVICWIFRGLDRMREMSLSVPSCFCNCRPLRSVAEKTEQSYKWQFAVSAVLLFVCWIPVWLAVFPGLFAYDATDELTQVVEKAFVTRHPLLHVLLLGGIVSKIYEITGSWNAGIAVYEVFQMAVMASVFAGLLCGLKKMGAPRVLRGAALVFLGFFPVISLFVLCTSKDTLYCAGMLAVLVLLCLLVTGKKEAAAGIRFWIGLVCGLAAMAIFRNNGYYVFLVMIPVMLWLAGKTAWKKMLLCLICALMLVNGSNAALKAVLHPESTDAMETLTVPIQQLTRAYVFSPELFSEEEKETLYEILPGEVMERYNPKLSDPVKIDFRTENFRQDPAKYASLWAKIGLRAPFTYVNAWLMTSYGFWYPDTVIDVYNGQRNYTQSSYFSGETEEPGYRDSKFPLLERVIKRFSWGILQQRMPVISMLFSPGFLCWIYVLAGLYLLARKQLYLVAAFGPVYLNWLTVLLGPTYLVRYVLIFWFALPLLVWMVLRPDDAQKQEA